MAFSTLEYGFIDDSRSGDQLTNTHSKVQSQKGPNLKKGLIDLCPDIKVCFP